MVAVLQTQDNLHAYGVDYSGRRAGRVGRGRTVVFGGATRQPLSRERLTLEIFNQHHL